jgi:hypothetical protein
MPAGLDGADGRGLGGGGGGGGDDGVVTPALGPWGPATGRARMREASAAGLLVERATSSSLADGDASSRSR